MYYTIQYYYTHLFNIESKVCQFWKFLFSFLHRNMYSSIWHSMVLIWIFFKVLLLLFCTYGMVLLINHWLIRVLEYKYHKRGPTFRYHISYQMSRLCQRKWKWYDIIYVFYINYELGAVSRKSREKLLKQHVEY